MEKENLKIKKTEAIEIVKEHLTDDQIDFILNDYLWDENTYDIQTRLNEIKGYKRTKVMEED